MKARYLSFFSYIGTSFRSSEKIWFKEGRQHPDPDSIQGMMELALLKLRPVNYPTFVLSSRTDGGVHALNNCAHFDLQRPGSGIYNPDTIPVTLNKYFNKTQTGMFVKKCIRVNDDFHARFHAISRTYLFRIAVLKERLPENISFLSVIPVEEWGRCYFTDLENFNIEKFKEGSKYFIGYHDFTTFKRFDKSKQHKHNRRAILSLNVRPGAPLVTSYTKHNNLFDYWDIEIQGRGFVHNQIRRMVGALNSVAIGKISPEEIKVMLQIPSKHSWHSFLQSCPPHGLYLCNVQYNPQDLVHNPVIETERSQTDTGDRES